MNEMLAVITITIIAVISPGADFAMVTRNSISISRKIGFFTSLGISLGVLVHVTYSILGIGLIISSSIILFNVIKVIGALYLIYLGIKMILTKKVDIKTEDNISDSISSKKAFKLGFFTNVLNPKTTLFIVSVFAQVIDTETLLIYKILYGMFMSLTHLIWFALVAYVFSSVSLKNRITNVKHIIERSIGGVLVLLGLSLARATLQ
ncbi:MAG: LysE family translocator [Spirochaetaceae bacterium]